MDLKAIAAGLVTMLGLAAPAAAIDRDAYGCAAEVLPCPAHLTADEMRLILGFASVEEARAYYRSLTATSEADGFQALVGTYRPLVSEHQIVLPQSCLVQYREPAPLGPDYALRQAQGGMMWGKTPVFPYKVSESDALFILGLCGPTLPGGARPLSDWVGPGPVFWASSPPDRANDTMDYWVTAPGGRIIHAMATEHVAVPLSVGGGTEGWLVSLYEVVPGTGSVVTIETGGTAGEATTQPLPPAPVQAVVLAERFWDAEDPCAAMRRVAAGFDLLGESAMIPERVMPEDGPQRCAELYADLLRRLGSGAAPPLTPVALPTFLWTLP